MYREEKACDKKQNDDDDDDMLLHLTAHNSVRYIRHTAKYPAVLHATAQYTCIK
jgi:hypothetical protein